MRTFIMVVVLSVIGFIALVTWLMVREPSAAQASRIAEVLASTAPPDEPPAYAHCASCHLHDGSGRPDGSIPRLAGQRRSVLENKLYLLRMGTLRLPVMEPYARTLAPDEIAEVAGYLSQLPEPSVTSSGAKQRDEEDREEQTRGASLYAAHCASCHGAHAEGNDGLRASRLCGQYAGYLNRRLAEVAARTRGDADAVMQGVIDVVPVDELPPIVAWLAAKKGCTRHE